MAAQICTKCGYEGRGKPGERGSGTGFRILGMLLLLPIYSIWRMFSGRRTKNCPHCGLPTMVKLNSDAGRLAQQRIDVELGLITPREEKKLEAFGQEAAAPRKERTVDPDQW